MKRMTKKEELENKFAYEIKEILIPIKFPIFYNYAGDKLKLFKRNPNYRNRFVIVIDKWINVSPKKDLSVRIKQYDEEDYDGDDVFLSSNVIIELAEELKKIKKIMGKGE